MKVINYLVGSFIFSFSLNEVVIIKGRVLLKISIFLGGGEGYSYTHCEEKIWFLNQKTYKM